MQIHKIYPMGFASNTYAVTAEGKNCILIDCAQERVYDKCKSLGLEPKFVLLTHGHYDHIGGCGALFEAGAKIYCGAGEEKLIFSDANRAVFHGIEIPYFEIYKTLKDGENIRLCGIDITVIATPGHTAGGVSYLIGDCLFTGDTLFFESVGRTDLATGSSRDLVNSVKKLYAIDGDKKVYCGHGDDTTLNHERACNPYINSDT